MNTDPLRLAFYQKAKSLTFSQKVTTRQLTTDASCLVKVPMPAPIEQKRNPGLTPTWVGIEYDLGESTKSPQLVGVRWIPQPELTIIRNHITVHTDIEDLAVKPVVSDNPRQKHWRDVARRLRGTKKLYQSARLSKKARFDSTRGYPGEGPIRHLRNLQAPPDMVLATMPSRKSKTCFVLVWFTILFIKQLLLDVSNSARDDTIGYPGEGPVECQHSMCPHHLHPEKKPKSGAARRKAKDKLKGMGEDKKTKSERPMVVCSFGSRCTSAFHFHRFDGEPDREEGEPVVTGSSVPPYFYIPPTDMKAFIPNPNSPSAFEQQKRDEASFQHEVTQLFTDVSSAAVDQVRSCLSLKDTKRGESGVLVSDTPAMDSIGARLARGAFRTSADMSSLTPTPPATPNLVVVDQRNLPVTSASALAHRGTSTEFGTGVNTSDSKTVVSDSKSGMQSGVAVATAVKSTADDGKRSATVDGKVSTSNDTKTNATPGFSDPYPKHNVSPREEKVRLYVRADGDDHDVQVEEVVQHRRCCCFRLRTTSKLSWRSALGLNAYRVISIYYELFVLAMQDGDINRYASYTADNKPAMNMARYVTGVVQKICGDHKSVTYDNGIKMNTIAYIVQRKLEQEFVMIPSTPISAQYSPVFQLRRAWGWGISICLCTVMVLLNVWIRQNSFQTVDLQLFPGVSGLSTATLSFRTVDHYKTELTAHASDGGSLLMRTSTDVHHTTSALLLDELREIDSPLRLCWNNGVVITSFRSLQAESAICLPATLVTCIVNASTSTKELFQNVINIVLTHTLNDVYESRACMKLLNMVRYIFLDEQRRGILSTTSLSVMTGLVPVKSHGPSATLALIDPSSVLGLPSYSRNHYLKAILGTADGSSIYPLLADNAYKQPSVDYGLVQNAMFSISSRMTACYLSACEMAVSSAQTLTYLLVMPVTHRHYFDSAAIFALNAGGKICSTLLNSVLNLVGYLPWADWVSVLSLDLLALSSIAGVH